jgi:hypothetical protein
MMLVLHVANALLKDHAASVIRMPAITNAANHRWSYNDWCRCNHNRSPRYDYGCIRPTRSIWSPVKSRTTAARSIGALDAGE